MNERPRLLLVSLLLLSLTALLGVYTVPFLAPSAYASHDGDDWAPLGPFYDRILVEVYGENEPAMFLALRQGRIDLTDWNVPPSELGPVCNDPNLHCELNAGIEMWGFDFNNHPAARYWGVIKGSDVQAVIEIKRAIAHLTDKDHHISTAVGGLAERLDTVMPGFRDFWPQPFDSMHQGPQTVQGAADDPGLTNAIRVTVTDPAKVSKPNADVYLVHITGDKNKEGVLGTYAGLCRDGFKCAVVSSGEQTPGVDGILGTRDDDFNFFFDLYNDPAKDGIVTFRSLFDRRHVDGTWDKNEQVIHDNNADGIYQRGTDNVLYTAGLPEPETGTQLRADPLIKYRGGLVFSKGDPVIYDNNLTDGKLNCDLNNNPVENIIVGPIACNQAVQGSDRLKFIDTSAPGKKIPLPTTGTYIVFAVNKGDQDFGWGHLTPPNDSITVHTGQLLDTGGWYNKTPFPGAGFEEYCEARDHLVSIHTDINNDGIDDTPFKDSDNNCRIDTDSAIYGAPGYRKSIWRIRLGLFRQELGDAVAVRMETLFGGLDVIDEIRTVRSAVVPVVFTGKPFDDWEVYTMGWGLTRDPDYIDDLYNRQFGWPPCGIGDDQILEGSNNYGSFCDLLYSSAARGAKNTFDGVMFKLAGFLFNHAIGSYPVWANAGFQAYHNPWTGVVDVVGTGIIGLQSVLNMYPKKDCVGHAKLLFTDLNANGCWDFGEPLTMRWSFFSDTRQINAFQSNWKWDFQIWFLLYDTLQGINPYQLQEDYSAMASSWQNFVNPTAAQLGYTPTGDTKLTQRWFVKSHLGWSDLKPVTGKDVAFSLLAPKEIDSSTFIGTVLPITYVRLVSDVPSQIVVDVGMDVAAPQFQAGHLAGTLPIVPCNVYSTGLAPDGPDADILPDQYTLPNCGGIQVGVTYPNVRGGTVSGMDRRSEFDVTFVPDADGDGRAESDCNDLGSHRTGHKGTGPFTLNCSTNGTSSPGLGGGFVLLPHVVQKSQFAKSREYWASPHNFLFWRLADFNNNGVVDTGDKARTRTNPPTGCRQKAVPTNQALWDANGDGLPDDICVQFDFNRNGISSDISDRARMTLEGGKRWTDPCVWPWPGSRTCAGAPAVGQPHTDYPWVSWVWWVGHQCNGLDRTKGTADDDKNACWFTKFASRPP